MCQSCTEITIRLDVCMSEIKIRKVVVVVNRGRKLSEITIRLCLKTRFQTATFIDMVVKQLFDLPTVLPVDITNVQQEISQTMYNHYLFWSKKNDNKITNSLTINNK